MTEIDPVAVGLVEQLRGVARILGNRRRWGRLRGMAAHLDVGVGWDADVLIMDAKTSALD